MTRACPHRFERPPSERSAVQREEGAATRAARRLIAPNEEWQGQTVVPFTQVKPLVLPAELTLEARHPSFLDRVRQEADQDAARANQHPEREPDSASQGHDPGATVLGRDKGGHD